MTAADDACCGIYCGACSVRRYGETGRADAFVPAWPASLAPRSHAPAAGRPRSMRAAARASSATAQWTRASATAATAANTRAISTRGGRGWARSFRTSARPAPASKRSDETVLTPGGRHSEPAGRARAAVRRSRGTRGRAAPAARPPARRRTRWAASESSSAESCCRWRTTWGRGAPEAVQEAADPARSRRHRGIHRTATPCYICLPYVAPVAQLDRASASGAEGYRFEPYRAYHQAPPWPAMALP